MALMIILQKAKDNSKPDRLQLLKNYFSRGNLACNTYCYCIVFQMGNMFAERNTIT